MRFPYLVFAAFACAPISHTAASETTAFKTFPLGDSSSSVQRQRGVDCARPVARPLPKDLTGQERMHARKMAELEAAKDGDLICKVRSQTIAGHPIEKTVLRIYSDRLLQIELSLKFKPLRRDTRNHYYPSSPEIEHVFDALKSKYGSPGERRIRFADCSCFVVTSDWKRTDGTTITMERREESASEAKVVFTAPQFKKVHEERLVASSKATSVYIEAKRRKAEEARIKNLRDL
ncbi:hypothetical protein [Massilia varians]|uniref:hypothetical protein n=1 Tax=Massilia varians TaxID=457921 RepID=UPI002552D1A2|nr:hypothetical protein [Massilia varians]MDK6079644.1 hypothetical protein [Massilia varians]